MSLKHVVLALVADEPCHGYRLHERAAGLLALASPRETSRVYGVLVGLEGAGLVVSRLEEGGRARARKVYRITPRGEAELRRWIERPHASGALLRRRLLVELAVLESTGARPVDGVAARRRWRVELDRRRRLHEDLAVPAGEPAGSIVRLFLERARAHVEIEIRTIEDLLRSE